MPCPPLRTPGGEPALAWTRVARSGGAALWLGAVELRRQRGWTPDDPPRAVLATAVPALPPTGVAWVPSGGKWWWRWSADAAQAVDLVVDAVGYRVSLLRSDRSYPVCRADREIDAVPHGWADQANIDRRDPRDGTVILGGERLWLPEVRLDAAAALPSGFVLLVQDNDIRVVRSALAALPPAFGWCD